MQSCRSKWRDKSIPFTTLNRWPLPRTEAIVAAWAHLRNEMIEQEGNYTLYGAKPDPEEENAWRYTRNISLKQGASERNVNETPPSPATNLRSERNGFGDENGEWEAVGHYTILWNITLGFQCKTRIEVTAKHPRTEILAKQIWLIRQGNTIGDILISGNIRASLQCKMDPGPFCIQMVYNSEQMHSSRRSWSNETITCHVHHSTFNTWPTLQFQCLTTFEADHRQSTPQKMHKCLWVALHPNITHTPAPRAKREMTEDRKIQDYVNKKK